jgi:predicted component of type VI protein secretion system
MVLESLSLEQKNSRMVHILHPDISSLRPFLGKFMVGRGQDCDIKVSDISVSRYHCEIRFRNG